MRISRVLGGGSALGALFAIILRTFINERMSTFLLYIMVLFSGLSNIIPKKPRGHLKERQEIKSVFLFFLGFGIGLICSLSGAGGPVLAVPLLMLMGIEVHEAIGISLYESIFIAIPALIGFSLQIEFMRFLPILVVAGFSHLIGIFLGSRYAGNISQKTLKFGIAVISIGVSMWKLISFI